MPDAINNAFQPFEHIIVPKTKHAISMRLQNIGACRIVSCRITVLAAIKFYNHFWEMTGKVSDEFVDWHLSAEVPTF
jgi:hypothetical protein